MDQRTKKTRRKIENGLTKLLDHHHLDQITVKDLCRLININRSTFYRNYHDVYDVYEQMEQQIMQLFLANNDIKQSRVQLLKQIYDHQSFYRKFLYSRLESKYIKKAIQEMY